MKKTIENFKLKRELLIRDSHIIDLFRAVVGMIILFFIFLTLCYYGIDGLLINAIIAYVAALSGLGYGLFFIKKQK